MTDTTQEERLYAGLLNRLREHVGFNSDGVGSTDTAHCRPASKRYDPLHLQAAECITTLKAENERLRQEIADWKFSAEREGDRADQWMKEEEAAKSQAAAMAGLLEEALDMLGWPGCNDEAAALHHKIDAALAAWKRDGEGK